MEPWTIGNIMLGIQWNGTHGATTLMHAMNDHLDDDDDFEKRNGTSANSIHSQVEEGGHGKGTRGGHSTITLHSCSC